jgi:hypothetical protein
MKHEGAERASEEVQEVRDKRVAVLVKEPYARCCVSFCTFVLMRQYLYVRTSAGRSASRYLRTPATPT